ncbi:hypothetical protein MtrunA17_Chr3g0079191 [Medicago truncatula]|uniref:Ubiquitin family protein n=1 Tax=Medicago truncatula TaxID=3880 RepID=G7IVN3_MEDTR|nr:uncharacterized protein LOC11411787 [Medicago truncatula]AES68452.1 ubiquitin family protein [Medicago truncatula]RHN65373.1 hypothetical protein MtrunA17_Chr3g0079191 [Medicago truncatula]
MVFIVPPSGEKFSLDVNPNATTVHQLKVAIQQFNGMPVSNQRLFFSGSLGQNDSDLISNLGIGPFSTLTLHTPFYGGAADDDTIGANSSTTKEELVKETEVESDSESDKEAEAEAKAKEEAYEYFFKYADLESKMESNSDDDRIFESRRKRLAAENEKQRTRVIIDRDLKKIFTELDHELDQEYKEGLEEDKKVMEELQKAEEAWKRTKAMEREKAKRKANKKGKKELDMKIKEAEAKEG